MSSSPPVRVSARGRDREEDGEPYDRADLRGGVQKARCEPPFIFHSRCAKRCRSDRRAAQGKAGERGARDHIPDAAPSRDAGGDQRHGAFALAADGHAGIADAARQRSATYRVTRSRLEGYAAAFSGAGFSWEDVPVYECPGSTTALGRTAAHALLAADPRPTTILATSDQLALGAIEAAGERGLSVPDDVSVVGFDDVPPAATATPPLTTVNQDHTRKGLLAGGLLVTRLQGEKAPRPDLLSARLVTRGSTGPARKGRPKRRPTR
jgi:hypothetical protein